MVIVHWEMLIVWNFSLCENNISFNKTFSYQIKSVYLCFICLAIKEITHKYIILLLSLSYLVQKKMRQTAKIKLQLLLHDTHWAYKLSNESPKQNSKLFMTNAVTNRSARLWNRNSHMFEKKHTFLNLTIFICLFSDFFFLLASRSFAYLCSCCSNESRKYGPGHLFTFFFWRMFKDEKKLPPVLLGLAIALIFAYAALDECMLFIAITLHECCFLFRLLFQLLLLCACHSFCANHFLSLCKRNTIQDK